MFKNSTTQRILLIVAVTLLLAGVYFSSLGNIAGAVPTYAAAFLCLIFMYLPHFKKFKALGIEAELLTQKMDEYDKTGDMLRRFWKPDGDNTIVASNQKLREWMKENDLGKISVSAFLRGNLLADARRKAIKDLRLD